MAKLGGIRVMHKIVKKDEPTYRLKAILREMAKLIYEVREQGVDVHLVIQVDNTE